MNGRKHKMHKRLGRLSAWLLAVMLAFAMMPATAFAEEEAAEEEAAEEESEDEEVGEEASGDEDTGEENSEEENSGDEEPGDEKTGEEDPGEDNPGKEENGNEDSGEENSEDEEPGDEEFEDEEPGDEEFEEEESVDEEPGEEAAREKGAGDSDPDAGIALVSDDTETAVAQIGSTTYTSLYNAFSAASDGDTITLIADTTESSTITISKSVTLDLGTYTLTLASNGTRIFNIASGGSLTVTGSGTVTNEGTPAPMASSMCTAP